jgi:hypothetical protein
MKSLKLLISDLKSVDVTPWSTESLNKENTYVDNIILPLS